MSNAPHDSLPAVKREGAWYAAAPAAIGAVTVAIAVALAVIVPVRHIGGAGEYFSFALWSVPLGFLVSAAVRRWPLERLPPVWRACALSLIGLLIGLVTTFVASLFLAGLVFSWGVPVLYCWGLAGALGMLFGVWSVGAIQLRHGVLGSAVALMPLAALLWVGTRPDPAVLIVYRDSAQGDAATLVFDSVLTVAHPSGTGREIRWPYSSYSRTRYDGHVAALIVLHDADDRASLRQAVASHPLVLTVIDTMVARGE